MPGLVVSLDGLRSYVVSIEGPLFRRNRRCIRPFKCKEGDVVTHSEVNDLVFHHQSLYSISLKNNYILNTLATLSHILYILCAGLIIVEMKMFFTKFFLCISDHPM